MSTSTVKRRINKDLILDMVIGTWIIVTAWSLLDMAIGTFSTAQVLWHVVTVVVCLAAVVTSAWVIRSISGLVAARRVTPTETGPFDHSGYLIITPEGQVT